MAASAGRHHEHCPADTPEHVVAVGSYAIGIEDRLTKSRFEVPSAEELDKKMLALVKDRAQCGEATVIPGDELPQKLVP